jgi:hypothetical protein
VSLEELEALPDKHEGPLAAEQRINVARLSTLIQHLVGIPAKVNTYSGRNPNGIPG